MHDTRGFDRAELASGESKSVSMTLDPRVFSYYDVRSKAWKIDAGRFTLSAGDNLENLPLTAPVESPK
jgi:beta-glucosidase